MIGGKWRESIFKMINPRLLKKANEWKSPNPPEVIYKPETTIIPVANPNSPLTLPEIVQRAPRNYIKIPQLNEVIAINETHKGKDLYDTLDAVADEGLSSPYISSFMRHWMNVKEAVVDRKGKLHYADGSQVPADSAEDLWKYLSSGHRGGCWTWLDALFTKEGNEWYLTQDLKTVRQGQDQLLQGNKQKLEACLRKDCYVDLSFNTQGLATQESPTQNYSQGENIYFYHPRENCVARFYASSVRTGLGCNGDPSGRFGDLGVFAVVRNK